MQGEFRGWLNSGGREGNGAPDPAFSPFLGEMAGPRAWGGLIRPGGEAAGLKPLARKQTGQAFPGDAPGAATPLDSRDPTVTNHPVNGATGDNQEGRRLIGSKKALLLQ